MIELLYIHNFRYLENCEFKPGNVSFALVSH